MDINDIEKHFDTYADMYHEQRINNKKIFNESIEAPAIKSLLNNFPGKSVLDIGCGTGILSHDLSKDFNMDVTAIDISNKMLEIAKSYCLGLNINFIKSDFHVFNSKKLFDLIIGSFFLGYCSNLESTFIKLKKLLKKDGSIILSMVHPVRMSMDSHDEEKYVISQYFSSKPHKVIIVPDQEPLFMPRRTFETIINTALESGFILKKILEPTPTKELNDTKRFNLYSSLPTVVVFEFNLK